MAKKDKEVVKEEVEEVIEEEAPIEEPVLEPTPEPEPKLEKHQLQYKDIMTGKGMMRRYADGSYSKK